MMKINKLLSLAVLATLFACQPEQQETPLSTNEILSKSIQYHDPDGNWDELDLNVYLQEPRLGNPVRYSELRINNVENTFELKRNRDQYVSTHSINEAGEALTLLDGAVVSDTNLIKAYRLDPARNFIYRDSYWMRYGLPMTLQGATLKDTLMTATEFNGRAAYALEFVLEKPIFSKDWIVYFAKDNFRMLGLEMIFPEDASRGERIYFDQEIEIKGIRFPRMRHWQDYADDAYAGSDILIKELE